MAREYFCAYHSYRKSIETLTEAEVGRLFVACLEYSETGATPELRGSERHVFPTIREQIDRDRDKYEKKCEKNRLIALKREADRRDANVHERVPESTNVYENHQEKEKDKDKDKKEKKSVRFAPPTLSEISEYCLSRGNNVDPKRFCDYFTASNWVDSEGKPVKNWKQKVITWEGRPNNKDAPTQSIQELADPSAGYIDLAEQYYARRRNRG